MLLSETRIHQSGCHEMPSTHQVRRIWAQDEYVKAYASNDYYLKSWLLAINLLQWELKT